MYIYIYICIFIWASRGLLCHDVGAYVCTVMLLGACGEEAFKQRLACASALF